MSAGCITHAMHGRKWVVALLVVDILLPWVDNSVHYLT
jgi:hypothetical protein